MDDYKFALILDNGQVKRFGDSKSEDYHVACMLDAARNMYPDSQIFEMLNEKHLPTTIAYYLTEMGNIVFLNLTHYKREGLTKYGKSGMFMIPDEITQSQLESLRNFEKEIVGFDVTIRTDLRIEDGFLETKTLSGMMGSLDDKLVELISKNTTVIEDKKAR